MACPRRIDRSSALFYGALVGDYGSFGRLLRVERLTRGLCCSRSQDQLLGGTLEDTGPVLYPSKAPCKASFFSYGVVKISSLLEGIKYGGCQ